MVSQFALNEQNMNAVERVLHYSELPSEGAATTPNDPPMTWPTKGHISFTDVELAYREGLPLVLKGITFDVKPGEKVCKRQLCTISHTKRFNRSELWDVLERVSLPFENAGT